MSDAINQHKRMAMGKSAQGYARGGSVGNVNATPVGGGALVPKPGGGLPRGALATARRNNGVPGMCSGGRVKGK